MVTVEYIIHTALKHDTVMSRAFLKACGIPVTSIPTPRASIVVSVDVAEEFDRDLVWCFKNYGSPMDGLWRQSQ